jgi:hypothetical protein
LKRFYATVITKQTAYHTCSISVQYQPLEPS